MPTIGYYFSSCPDTEYMPDVMVEISDAEFLRREQAPMIRREETGRTARKEISLYDAMLAEILDERNAEKAKVRRNRKQKRNHKAEELMSEKEKRKMRNIRTFGKSAFPEDHVRYIDVTYCGGGTKAWFGRDDEPTVTMRKNAEAEKFARADWELEKDNHAETMRKISNLESVAEGIYDMMDEIGVEEDDFMFMELTAEVNSYLSASHRLWCDEEYYRKSKSIGVNPRDYLGITRRK